MRAKLWPKGPRSRTRSPNVLHVLKRWAAWLRGDRWLAGIAAVVLGLAIAWVLFVPIADWLAHHDVGSVRGSLHETALDNARGRLLTLAAGVFAAGALAFTARNFTLSRRTLDVTEQGQVTDRYAKAIEQLGSDKLDVRIGGIYALERVARDSARDHPTVMEVLTAFIREHSQEQWPPPDHPGNREQERLTRPDVQAAVTVVGRRNVERDIQPLDLVGADLAGADLHHANLAGADLTGANLIGANLHHANLTRADLTDAHLTRADLSSADLTGAGLDGADLDGADLNSAGLVGAGLIGTYLAGAGLAHADLSRANLAHADLRNASLTGANLTGANLTRADLANATWPENAPVPEGWKRHTGSGRLIADGGAETSEG
jgi:uncharacterized protein YjbI with pentapeptide repeats